ncbi:hypothetical protein ACFOZ0_24200 [Streptomyces yaanensis]|uniref:DUF4034 domain-containing protein n=1 Tax=Streptomyces yaanensis TaxID=1142239 RepID=A0ABV7SM35_9ACTN|nr:hypothetical protein [Streptomyces sp. CGMCC 4.7035]WNC01300.1 hypothetical protein Q2K21_26410 [Streptomyces sp. CGMCC 4.7035]
MALMRAFLRTVRERSDALEAPGKIRNPSRRADGLPADDEVLLDAPDERLAPALVAAGRGDYGPTAELLAATREAAEWEDRDRYVVRLAAFARSRDEWFADWCAAAPNDPDALLVKAELAVARGWQSPARTELLREVGPLIEAAAEGDPRDPVPWRVALDHARGTDAGHAEYERLWGEAIRRSPHHYGCHVAALQYLSGACRAQWVKTPHGPGGSHEECLDFAETAAQDSPPGSLVQALPVRAAFKYLTEGDGAVVARGRLDAAADRAIALSSRYAPADPWPAEVRNLLTFVLVALERWEDASTQLRMIGPYATSFPWDRVSDDPLGRFLDVRNRVRLRVTSPKPPRSARLPLPRSEHAGHATFCDH